MMVVGRYSARAPIEATAAELDSMVELWRFVAWLRAWQMIGAMFAEVTRRERALWTEH